MFWEHTFLLSLSEGFTNYYKFCWINNILNPLNVTVNMMKWAESGWAEANFLWGAIVNSEK